MLRMLKVCSLGMFFKNVNEVSSIANYWHLCPFLTLKLEWLSLKNINLMISPPSAWWPPVASPSIVLGTGASVFNMTNKCFSILSGPFLYLTASFLGFLDFTYITFFSQDLQCTVLLISEPLHNAVPLLQNGPPLLLLNSNLMVGWIVTSPCYPQRCPCPTQKCCEYVIYMAVIGCVKILRWRDYSHYSNGILM